MDDKILAKEFFHISTSSFPKKSPWSQENFLSFLKGDHHFFFTFELDKRIVGFILFSHICDEVDILLLTVEKKNQRRGIGQFLLKKCVNHCIENNAKDIYIEVRKSNMLAQHLYDRNGFKVLSIRKNYYKNPTDDAIILKLSV